MFTKLFITALVWDGLSSAKTKVADSRIKMVRIVFMSLIYILCRVQRKGKIKAGPSVLRACFSIRSKRSARSFGKKLV